MDKEDLKEVISENLRYLRNKKGLTQEQLIYNIGEEKISLRSYKSYESMNSPVIPSLEKLMILSDYYDCSIDFILYFRESTDDYVFTKKADLKRLCALIYSLALIPIKDTNSDSNYCSQYYFASFDPEIHLLVDKMNASSREEVINLAREKKDNKRPNLIESFYALVEEIPDLKEEWDPSEERLNKIIEKTGNNKDVFYANQLEKLDRYK